MGSEERMWRVGVLVAVGNSVQEARSERWKAKDELKRIITRK